MNKKRWLVIDSNMYMLSYYVLRIAINITTGSQNLRNISGNGVIKEKALILNSLALDDDYPKRTSTFGPIIFCAKDVCRERLN